MGDRNQGRALVGAQLALLFLIAIAPPGRLWPKPPWVALAAGLTILAGAVILLFAVWHLGSAFTAHPLPKENAELSTRGLYSHVRHPIYTGLLVLGVGAVLRNGSLLSLLALIALSALLDFKARWEEKFLLAKHTQYLDYMAKVPRFFPKLRTHQGRDG